MKRARNNNKAAKAENVARALLQHAMTKTSGRQSALEGIVPFAAVFARKNKALLRNAEKTVMKNRGTAHILKTHEDPRAVMYALNNGADPSVLTGNNLVARFGTMAGHMSSYANSPNTVRRRRAETYAVMLTRLLNGVNPKNTRIPGDHDYDV